VTGISRNAEPPPVEQELPLQWGPVVVTGIRVIAQRAEEADEIQLQWGPVVVTGIRRQSSRGLRQRRAASMGSGRGDRNQTREYVALDDSSLRFNGVRSW